MKTEYNKIYSEDDKIAYYSGFGAGVSCADLTKGLSSKFFEGMTIEQQNSFMNGYVIGVKTFGDRRLLREIKSGRSEFWNS